MVTEPKHSLIHQSYKARERIEPLNGDGFGIGWYVSGQAHSPALYKEVSPAWSNRNLRDIARVIKSSCIFAHVRAATIGGEVTRSNCHPFTWKNYLFMHNGTIFEFDKIRRKLRRLLSDAAYKLIEGNTDTEHLFALFVDRIQHCKNPTVHDLREAVIAAVRTVELLKKEEGVTKPSTMNLALSDGQSLVATRYVSTGEQSNSLYYAKASRFFCQDGICHMDRGGEAILVVSEPLDCEDMWQRVENNQMVIVNAEREVECRDFHL